MNDLARRLRAALARPLPGLDAQLRMAPAPRVGWDPHHVPQDLRQAAGLVLLYPLDDAPHLLLTVRGGSMRQHTGQVALPGGAVDPGETIEDAAVREAEEEVGADRAAIEIVGRLTPLHIPVSGFLLHPVVGVALGRPAFRPADFEVARIIEVPLSRILDAATVRREQWARTRDGAPVTIDVPFFDIDGDKVWGATAMVLAEFAAVAAASDIVSARRG